MITAGIDLGIETVKVVILKDGRVAAKELMASGGSGRAKWAETCWEKALEQVGRCPASVETVIATGLGKQDIHFANDYVVDTVADVKGILWLYPQARSVIDIGADQARAVRFDAKGQILEYALNQKCAAGLGLFLETQARMLEMSLEEISKPAAAKKKVVINDQCGGYAELDIVTLIHNNTPKASVIQAIHDIIATRINSLVNEISLEKNVAMIGGVARSEGIAKALKKQLCLELQIPEHPEFVGALGAALIAAG